MVVCEYRFHVTHLHTHISFSHNSMTTSASHLPRMQYSSYPQAGTLKSKSLASKAPRLYSTTSSVVTPKTATTHAQACPPQPSMLQTSLMRRAAGLGSRTRTTSLTSSRRISSFSALLERACGRGSIRLRYLKRCLLVPMGCAFARSSGSIISVGRTARSKVRIWFKFVYSLSLRFEQFI